MNEAISYILFPLGGMLLVGLTVYFAIYQYYRNTDKSYEFETQTSVEVVDVQMYDRPTRRYDSLRSRMMNGHNTLDHRQRVRRVPLK
ncbi:hypothetical protein M3A96_11200 [Helcobacillus massiliensis]|uniref:Uncharacterized protein n=1 Tax=Helcobacillus massiliensis TaxID=521392 RepID=A0A839QUU1_9MICO|nr:MULTISPECIES: hypothetical protein [Helcobacillus]MBB3022619.1 hypothetical protein [Helcobacillus massiliensis]MCG7427612.1 hypothetical protein [Helcobacillus sp. ACRRO]MCT1558674.1 hypothetical protein [Helcobacillus massiliensis]MCT2037290.1 hypothetical protein [Helcobacillus massiliensis]MCT2332896.1 hypothetical protein [Helcobacillus massiliensis]